MRKGCRSTDKRYNPGTEGGLKGLSVRRIMCNMNLGLERREIVFWYLSTIGVKNLRGVYPSTRGPGKENLWWISYTIKEHR